MQYVQEISSNVPETLVLGCDVVESIFWWEARSACVVTFWVNKDLWQRWHSARPDTLLPGTAGRCNFKEVIVQKAGGRGQLPATITDVSFVRWEDQLNFIINKVKISMPDKNWHGDRKNSNNVSLTPKKKERKRNKEIHSKGTKFYASNKQREPHF